MGEAHTEGTDPRDEPGRVSKELRPLLAELERQLTRHEKDHQAVKTAMLNILEYLVTPEGRTDANCIAVDHFVMPINDWNPGEGLPEAFQLVLSDMGGVLHDAVSAKHIAENFRGRARAVGCAHARLVTCGPRATDERR